MITASCGFEMIYVWQIRWISWSRVRNPIWHRRYFSSFFQLHVVYWSQLLICCQLGPINKCQWNLKCSIKLVIKKTFENVACQCVEHYAESKSTITSRRVVNHIMFYPSKIGNQSSHIWNITWQATVYENNGGTRICDNLSLLHKYGNQVRRTIYKWYRAQYLQLRLGWKLRANELFFSIWSLEYHKYQNPATLVARIAYTLCWPANMLFQLKFLMLIIFIFLVDNIKDIEHPNANKKYII